MEEKNQEKKEKLETKATVKKKSIIPRTAVKGLINGFVSYGILLVFIFLTIVIFTTWLVENHKDAVDYNTLKYSLPILAAFLIFFLVRATCRLSTFDLFKNCKIDKKDIDSVCNKMNFFYICVVVFSVIVIIMYLIMRFSNEKLMITRELSQYSPSSTVSSYVEEREEELINNYEENKINTLTQTIIIEVGLLLGIFSLIPNQRRLIEQYN